MPSHTAADPINPRARLKGTETISLLLAQFGIDFLEERYVQVKTNRRAMWILEYGDIDPATFFNNLNNPEYKIFPNGFKIAAYAYGDCYIGEVSVLHINNIDSIKYRFSRVDPISAAVIVTGDWGDTPSGAMRTLDNTNPKLPDFASLIIGISYDNVQDKLRQYFSTKYQPLEAQLINQPLPTLPHKDIEPTADNKVTIGVVNSQNHLKRNPETTQTSAAAAITTTHADSAAMATPTEKIRSRHIPITTLQKLMQVPVSQERFVQVEKGKKSCWLINYGHISSDEYFNCIKHRTIIMPDGFKIATVIYGEYCLGEIRVSQNANSSSSANAAKRIEYRFSTIDAEAQFKNEGAWKANASKSLKLLFNAPSRINGALYIGITYKNIQDKLREFFQEKYFDLQPPPQTQEESCQSAVDISDDSDLDGFDNLKSRVKPNRATTLILKAHNIESPDDRFVNIEKSRKSAWILAYGEINSISCFSTKPEGTYIYPDGYKIGTIYKQSYCIVGEVRVQALEVKPSESIVQYKFSVIDKNMHTTKTSEWCNNPSAAINCVVEETINGRLYIGIDSDSVQTNLRQHYMQLHDNKPISNPEIRNQWDNYLNSPIKQRAKRIKRVKEKPCTENIEAASAAPATAPIDSFDQSRMQAAAALLFMSGRTQAQNQTRQNAPNKCTAEPKRARYTNA